MTIPAEPFTISGGCNCRAIRWRVDVPAHAERMVCPYKDRDADIGDLRMPILCFDHCNDCRAAVGAYLPAWICTDTSTVSVSLLPRPDKQSGDENDDDMPPKLTNDGPFLPANDVLTRSSSVARASYLTFYNSTPKRIRSFCSRCGTPVSYQVARDVLDAMGLKPMIDVPLGSVDRADLEREWMVPERRLWCDVGLPWLRRFAARGAPELPAHPSYQINRVVEPGT